MENSTVETVKQLLQTWDIRALILTSLIIQASLTLLAPRRKCSSNSLLKFLVWFLYLSADAVAVFVIGLISKNEVYSPQVEILAFWAPFLLLHLGGPDTITALALEDNELWRRHALQLASQVIITLYVFVQSFRRSRGLLIPTLLMFADGLIKYFERTCALFFASSNRFRDSLVTKPEPGPNYARLMEEYFSAKRSYIPTEFEGDKDGPLEWKSKEEREGQDPQSITGDHEEGVTNDVTAIGDDETKLIIEAHRFYEMSKPLLADGFLSLKDRDVSRDFFINRPAVEAFKIIQIELNLIYDVFYTKVFLLPKKRAFARVFCFISVIASLLFFYLKDRRKYQHPDAVITFILLGGAIALDLLAVLMFVLSDWWVIVCHDGMLKNNFQSLKLMILSWSRRARPCNHRRWSSTISKYNFLRSCFRKQSSFLYLHYTFKEINDILIGLLFVQEDEIEECLIEYVRNELRSKADLAQEITVAKEVCSARGNLVLQEDYFLASECLSPWTVDVDYDESLLMWHLATDICYWTTDNDAAAASNKDRIYSKTLSDYMAYLLLRQQTLVSAVVGMSETRFDHTCAEAKKFMNNKSINIGWLEDPWWKAKKFLCEKLCRRTMSGQDDAPSQRLENPFFKEIGAI